MFLLHSSKVFTDHQNDNDNDDDDEEDGNDSDGFTNQKAFNNPTPQGKTKGETTPAANTSKEAANLPEPTSSSSSSSASSSSSSSSSSSATSSSQSPTPQRTSIRSKK